MVYRKYSEFLPGYLGGNNINRHSGVIESTDNEIYNRISLLGLWNVLERPILIERVQEEPGHCTLHVHVNSETPIKTITTTGLTGNINEEYSEEEQITSVTLTTTATDMIPPCMPKFIVTVETYDDRVYKKGYLENDVIKNDVYDHDEFLDIIGNILGIPRRTYKDEVNGYDIRVYEKMYPKYFTKQMYSDHNAGYITEDDYYYAKRLQKFVEEYGTKPLYALIAELAYEWGNITTSSMISRNTSLTDNTIEYAETPVIQLVRGNETYNNIDYSNMNEMLNSYAPLTRPILISQPTLAYSVVTSKNTQYVNNSYVEVETWYEVEDPDAEEVDEGPLLNAPFQLYYLENDTETLLGTYYTDHTGIINAPINGLPHKQATIKIESVPEYEYYTNPEYAGTVTVNPSDEIDMSISAWKGKQYANTQQSQYIAPFFDNTIGVLNVGRRCLCHTPLLNLDLIDITEQEYKVTVEFSYSNQYQKIGLILISENNDGTAQNRTTWIDPYTILGADDAFNSHILECRIQEGVLHYWLDGEDTEITQTLTSYGGMLYIAGYNISALNAETPSSLYIWDANIEEIISVSDDCTTLQKWLVTDTGTPATINSQPGITSVRPPNANYQRIYWKYPLQRGTNSSIKFKVYITTNANGIILGSMAKYNSDHMTNVKSWWGGLGSSNNWTDGPNNSQNRHGGTRMSYNTWHTIEFKLEDNVLKTYVDNVSVRDYTIPNDISSNNLFNDYFFIGFNGNGVWIRDVEYSSNTQVTEDTLNSIRSAHLAQFN